MGHPPIGAFRGFQNLVMLLEDLPETCEVQVLGGYEGSDGVREA